MHLFRVPFATLVAAFAAFSPGVDAAGTADVQALTANRTGMAFYASGDAAADQAIADLVTCMLQDGLTKDEAVQIALLNNRNLQACLMDLGIARGELIEAGMLSNPFFEFVRKKAENPDEVDPIEFSIVQNFMDLVLLPLRRKVGQAEYEQTKAQVATQILNTAFDTQAAFYEIQAAAERARILRKSVDAYLASLEGAESLHEAGNLTDFDLHREQAAYEEQKLHLAEAENDGVELRERLNLLMGVWGPCTEWTVQPRLPAMPNREIQLTGLESLAICQRLDLEAARLEIEVTARKAGLSQITGLIPEFEIGYEGERESDGTWLKGFQLGMEIPIFNQGQGRITKSMARLCRAQNEYYAKAVEIRSEVREARTKMTKARERVRYYDNIMLPLRSRIVEEAQLLFNAMDLSPFELLAAKRDQIDAAREMVNATRDYWVARSELERAIGGSLACPRLPVSLESALEIQMHTSKAAGPVRSTAGQVYHFAGDEATQAPQPARGFLSKGEEE